MMKQVQLFLSQEDEVALSAALLGVRPELVFVDGSRWETSTPALASSIANCKSFYTFLWDQSIVKSLSSGARSDGQFDGPRAGFVIEISRSRMQDNLMLAGRIAVSIGGSDARLVSDMKAFYADVWKVLKKMTNQPIAAVDPETGTIIRTPVPEFRAGDHAIAWASSDPAHFFRGRSTQTFFKPAAPR